MKFSKAIALSLALIAIIGVLSLGLTSCGEKVCDICKIVPPTHSLKSSKKADLCDFCYQRVVQTETENDIETIKETDFSALNQRQKNYIVIFVIERIAYYDGVIGEPLNDELRNKVYDEASERYAKTVDEIKELVAAHDARGMEE